MSFAPNYQSAVLVQAKLISAVSVNNSGQVTITFSDTTTAGPMAIAVYSAIAPQPIVGIYQITTSAGAVSYITAATLAANYVSYSG